MNIKDFFKEKSLKEMLEEFREIFPKKIFDQKQLHDLLEGLGYHVSMEPSGSWEEGCVDIVFSTGQPIKADTVQVNYLFTEENGEIWWTPQFLSTERGYCGGSLRCSNQLGEDFGREVENKILATVPRVKVPLPEAVVKLPIPEWAVAEGFDENGRVKAKSLTMFRSQAKRLWEEFTAQKPEFL